MTGNSTVPTTSNIQDPPTDHVSALWIGVASAAVLVVVVMGIILYWRCNGCHRASGHRIGRSDADSKDHIPPMTSGTHSQLNDEEQIVLERAINGTNTIDALFYIREAEIGRSEAEGMQKGRFETRGSMFRVKASRSCSRELLNYDWSPNDDRSMCSHFDVPSSPHGAVAPLATSSPAPQSMPCTLSGASCTHVVMSNSPIKRQGLPSTADMMRDLIHSDELAAPSPQSPAGSTVDKEFMQWSDDAIDELNIALGEIIAAPLDESFSLSASRDRGRHFSS